MGNQRSKPKAKSEEGKEEEDVEPSPLPRKRDLAKVELCKDNSIFKERIAEALSRVSAKHEKEQAGKKKDAFAGAKRLNRTLLRFGKIREAFEQVEGTYRKYDLSKDGTIQFTALANCIRDIADIDNEEAVDATKIMFNSADLYDNGKLSFKEFLVGLHIGYVLGAVPLESKGGQNLKESFEAVVEAFLVFDLDTKGFFTREEMEESLDRLSSNAPSKQYIKARDSEAVKKLVASGAATVNNQKEFMAESKEEEAPRRLLRKNSRGSNIALQFLTKERMDEMDW